MKVAAFDNEGNSTTNQQGELYVWHLFLLCQSTFGTIQITASIMRPILKYIQMSGAMGILLKSPTGGVIIYGRSDATLNPGGVRIGTGEIYRLLDQIEEIEDSVIVGQSWKKDVRVILFVKLAAGYELTDDLITKIKQTIRANASPRHVPSKILTIPDVPYTLNMKKVELAVKKVIEGKPVLNKDALSNPESLDYYADIKELQED